MGGMFSQSSLYIYILLYICIYYIILYIILYIIYYIILYYIILYRIVKACFWSCPPRYVPFFFWFGPDNGRPWQQHLAYWRVHGSEQTIPDALRYQRTLNKTVLQNGQVHHKTLPWKIVNQLVHTSTNSSTYLPSINLFQPTSRCWLNITKPHIVMV